MNLQLVAVGGGGGVRLGRERRKVGKWNGMELWPSDA